MTPAQREAAYKTLVATGKRLNVRQTLHEEYAHTHEDFAVVSWVKTDVACVAVAEAESRAREAEERHERLRKSIGRDADFHREMIDAIARARDAEGRADEAQEMAEKAEDLLTLRDLEEEWPEETDNVLFWRVPVCEPPYVGTSLDTDFPDDWATHWSPMPQVVEPRAKDDTAGGAE